jgi:hypothetical protein
MGWAGQVAKPEYKKCSQNVSREVSMGLLAGIPLKELTYL